MTLVTGGTWQCISLSQQFIYPLDLSQLEERPSDDGIEMKGRKRSIHPSFVCSHLSLAGSQKDWSLSQSGLGQSRVTHWTLCQFITGLETKLIYSVFFFLFVSGADYHFYKPGVMNGPHFQQWGQVSICPTVTFPYSIR